MLLGMLLILPVLEVILLFPIFRSAVNKHGWQTLLLLSSAFSLEFLLTCFMIGWVTEEMLLKVGFSMVVYGLLI